MAPTSNVAAGAGGAHHADGVTHGVGQLEVAVDEVADLQDKIGSRDKLSTNPSPLLGHCPPITADLHEDAGPVDAVDGAEAVLGHVLRLREHRLDRHVQVVRGPVHGVAVHVVILIVER